MNTLIFISIFVFSIFQPTSALDLKNGISDTAWYLIIGGIVGAVVFIILLLICVYYTKIHLKKLRKRRVEQEGGSGVGVEAGRILSSRAPHNHNGATNEVTTSPLSHTVQRDSSTEPLPFQLISESIKTTHSAHPYKKNPNNIIASFERELHSKQELFEQTKKTGPISKDSANFYNPRPNSQINAQNIRKEEESPEPEESPILGGLRFKPIRLNKLGGPYIPPEDF